MAVDIHQYRRDLIKAHPHVGLAEVKGEDKVKCSCGWSFSHPDSGERRCVLREHLTNPMES